MTLFDKAIVFAVTAVIIILTALLAEDTAASMVPYILEIDKT